MIPFLINTMEVERLSSLVKELRGEKSVRAYCQEIGIHRAAWQTWEAGESIPHITNLQKIAALKGWSLEELISYLNTGDIKKPAYTVEEILSIGRTLPFEQRIVLARQLLAD